jgi:outer membrane protein OmpA-like peptidoglycan-associated protein
MAEDWSIDVKKYAPDADDKVIAAIVRYCGIALQNRDSSLVSFTDKAETDRVRENYCKKKLGLTQSDEELDAAIASVGERMKADTTKNRVTVYYLLAELFGKLGLFGAAATATAAAAEPAPVAAPLAAAAPVAAAAAVAAAPLAAAAPVAQGRRKDDDGGMISTGMIALGAMAAIIIGTAVVGQLIGNRVSKEPAPPAAPVAVAAPAPAPAAPAAPVIPEGAGLVAEDVAGKPKLSVYFDTAKADVTPDLPNEVGPLKAYLEANPTARLGVSGYNDPRGNAAFNAELSKNRAQNVAAALANLGLPADRIDLIKPIDTSDADTTLANARRVDIYVQE